jgi:multisubunit Na+/H+ antiporter MnhB subunit
MTTAWVLNAIGLFAVTAGALLMFLAFRKAPKSVPESPTPEDRRAYEKHRRLSTLAMGLIAAWLVIQYVGLLI